MLDQNLTPEQQQTKVWLRYRERARSDLFWLANEVLSPTDSQILVHHAHDCIVDHCQRFPPWSELAHRTQLSKYGLPLLMGIDPRRPRLPMWELEGDRDNLILVSRGHLKTTIHTIAHSIQWILNYPDVRILICTSTDEKAQLIVKEMKQHFQFNPLFRVLFPELCPDARKVSDWGSQTEFTVPGRNRKAKEPTVMTAAVGKALASTHHDVIKCSDVVTENNIRTDGQIQEVKDFFGYLEPLRERGESKDGQPNPGWKDVEGTIYHFADYYQMILDDEEKKETKAWRITKRSCWIDAAESQSLWPERFPPAELHRIENSPEVGPVLFASQYKLNPIRGVDGLATREQIRFFDGRLIPELIPRYRIHTTIDLANMDANSTGDYTVMSTCGFDRDGRCDVLSIQRGHFSDEEFVNRLFITQIAYPSNVDFKIQKDHFSVTLRGYIRREQSKRGIFLNIVEVPIKGAKTYRIIKGLQGWFMRGSIRFADSITCKNELVLEVLRFPKSQYDDILDTLADQFMNQSGQMNADIYPDAPKWTDFVGVPKADPRFIGFDPISKEQKWLGEAMTGGDGAYLHSMTGAL